MNPNNWKPVPIPVNLREFQDYETNLARAFHFIEKRGVFTHPERLEELRGFLLHNLEEVAGEISQGCSKYVAFSKKHAERLGWERKDYINLNYSKDVIELLKKRGLKIHHNRMTGRESSDEESLNRIYAETGDEIVMRILHAREYTKILGTYVNCRLHNGVLYTSYLVTGTVNGRRSSRKNLFGYGTNHQNIPKHSELGHRFRSCIIARPGKIFINCDQCQAEDWIVSGLIASIGGDATGLNELRMGVDRHKRLASILFHKPESAILKESPERFMGKKTRHAGNYDMGADEMARQMVREGHTGIPPGLCAWLLSQFHKANPGIKGVFHKYVQDQLSKTRMLRSPFGRERIFLNCRPFSDNSKVFKEAYSTLPQATVGDNTGLGVLYCESNEPGNVVMESHDAITLEVDDNWDSIINGFRLLSSCFDRVITLPGGLEIQIPIEFDLGYDLGNMIEMKNSDEKSILKAYEKCQSSKEEVHSVAEAS